MVTSETVPFSKSGGLADVVGALSTSIAKLGHCVKVFMPMYSFIDMKGFSETTRFDIEMLGKKEKITTVEKCIDNVAYVGVINRYFSQRKGIYGDNSFSPYIDNCPRFLLFSKAVVGYIKASGFSPDIVHCHDWTTGLVPFYLKEAKIKARSIFTIHNLAYQGVFPSLDSVLSGDILPKEAFDSRAIGKHINMLKCGISLSDKITTVSPSYSKEIQTSEFGCDLDNLLRERAKDLSGIINGIDYAEWDPNSDSYFKEHYSSRSIAGKKRLKARIQKENNLEVDDSIPLFAMISRLAEQKGFSELLLDDSPSALERILQKNTCQFIIVGTGDSRYVDKLKELEEKYSNLKVLIAFSDSFAHNIEGAADFFLMPSRYEPCGLNQLYSLHYGTLPVAHRIGGLADTIKDIRDDENGTGFLFKSMNTDEIVSTVDKAIDFFADKKALAKARRIAMEEDFTWTRSAEEYLELYNKKDVRKNIGGNKR